MASTVNLDALITREDFTAEESATTSNIPFQAISMNDLKSDLLTSIIRKPDFQRETRDWSTENVLNFINSVVNGQFIPSLILWKNSNGYIFIIDGAHRLSALIAWMKDDYGDGAISRSFFQNNISESQSRAAEQLRKRINSEIMAFSEYEKALIMPDAYESDFIIKSRRLISFAFSVQWITGNIKVAEESFFNINQRAVAINETELSLIKARTHDRCIAARAIMYSGSGNKYWKKFPHEKSLEIVELSKIINKLLFEPRYDKPIKTLDLPMCGKNQSNLPFIFDMINSIAKGESVVDDDGSLTIEILSKLRNLLELISSKRSDSLGLHPIVYFYSKKGNFKVSAFYAILVFINHISVNNQLRLFTSVRHRFEEFIYQYDYIIDQMNRSQRTTKKSIPILAQFYIDVLNLLGDGLDFSAVIDQIVRKGTYPKFFLDLPDENVQNNEFNENRKNEVFLFQAYPSAIKCPICQGLLHVNSISIDHITRRADGGSGEATNGQATHYYCNTTFKN